MSPPIDELTIGANGDEVRRASEWLDATCMQRGVPPSQAERLVLCLNEVLANVIDHGGPAALAEPISLRLEVVLDRDSGNASVSVSDAGTAFDPLSVPKKELPRTLDEAMPSGMGLEIIRRCSGTLAYRHQGGRNHFTFGTRWGLQ